MQGRPGRVGKERAGGPGRVGAGRVGRAGRLGCAGAGRAQALERDLSSVRLWEGERAPMLRLGRPVGREGERAEPDWRRGLAERRRERLAG